MNWTEQVDIYCERLDASFWAEPLNAASNAAFLIAAIFMWQRAGWLEPARLLCAILFVIGLGSGLFHTLATRWAALADVLPILAFALTYIFIAARDLMGWRTPLAVLTALSYVPFSAATVPLFSLIPGIGGSASYMPLPLLILIFALLLRPRAPATARNLTIGAAILLVSITFRSLDLPLCGANPAGTHFLWHILNATMLGWMIETYRRHMLASGATPR